MPSLAEFQKLIKEKPEEALKTYVIHVDQSLDGAAGADLVLVAKAYGEQEVVFEYVDPNIIRMRAKLASDATSKTVWYLPWVSQGAAKAVLDEKGSQYFSTSQLNGCRFTIQYDDATKKRATVLHLAGNFATGVGSMKREELETTEIGPVKDARLRRRYSIGQSSKMAGATRHKPVLGQYRILGDETRLYYDGNKASIFGYRTKAGAWEFWANEMREGRFDEADVPVGKKDLV